MVSSIDGKAAVGGKAGPIGSSADRTIMRTLRSHADAVMIGAGTLRAERLTLSIPENLEQARASRDLMPQPLAIVVTVSGEIPLSTNLLGFSPDNLLIFASPEAPEERLTALSELAYVEVLPKVAPSSQLNMKSALEILKKRYDVGVLLVEGGPRLNHDLVSSGLADELFLTLAPKLFGGGHSGTLSIIEGETLILPPEENKNSNVELISIHLSNNELYLRYALQPL